jgi:hypothetical protein
MGLELDGETTCLSAGCLNTQKRNTIMIVVKFAYSSLNSLLAIVFAIMFFKYNKTRIANSPSTQKSNVTAAMTILFELLFSVLPNFFILMVLNVSGKRIVSYNFNF